MLAAASAAAAYWAGLSFNPVAAQTVILAAVVVSALAIAGTASLSSVRALRSTAVRRSMTVLVVAVAVAAGVLSASVARSGPQPHLPLPNVSEVEGRVVAVRADRDPSVVDVAIDRVRSESGEASASGVLRVDVDGDRVSGTDGRAIAPGVRLIVATDALRVEPDGALSAGRAPVRVIDASTPVRHRGREAVWSHIDRVAGPSAPLLTALVLGDDAAVDPRTTLLFRRSGTIHLLALSGMHLAVIALLVGGAAGRLFGRRVAVIVTLAAATVYVAFIGGRPGLVRAALLVLAGAVVRSAGIRPRLIDLLCVVFVIQLVVQPRAVTSLGFQLSYASLAGIAVIAPWLIDRSAPVIPAAIGSPLAAGIGAQITTTGLLLSRFGVVYPVGVIATAVMGPVVLGFMTVGLVAVGLSMLGVTVISRLSVPLLGVLASALDLLGYAFSWFGGIAPSPVGPFSGGVGATIAAAAVIAGCALTMRGAWSRRCAVVDDGRG